MNGGVGFTGQSSSASCRSQWHTPVALILTSTAPRPGFGTGCSSMVNGLPNSRATAAFIVVAMSHPLSRCVAARNNQILATSRGGVDTQIPQTHRDERWASGEMGQEGRRPTQEG